MEHDSSGNCSLKLALLLEDLIKVVVSQICQAHINITWNLFGKDNTFKAIKKLNSKWTIMILYSKQNSGFFCFQYGRFENTSLKWLEKMVGSKSEKKIMIRNIARN